jgi:hypothetical protein
MKRHSSNQHPTNTSLSYYAQDNPVKDINTNPKEHIMTHLTNKLIQTALLASGLFLFSACGGGGTGEGSIDMAEYQPSSNMVKHYALLKKEGLAALRERRVIETIILNHIDGHTIINKNERQEELDGTLINTHSNQDIVYENNISSNAFGQDIERYVNLGDSIMGDPRELPIEIIDDDGHHVPVMLECTYTDELVDLNFGEVAYEGEIIETECEFSSAPFVLAGEQRQFHVSSYNYQKKGIGTIAQKYAFCKQDANIWSDLDMRSCPADKTTFEIKLLDPADS